MRLGMKFVLAKLKYTVFIMRRLLKPKQRSALTRCSHCLLIQKIELHSGGGLVMAAHPGGVMRTRD